MDTELVTIAMSVIAEDIEKQSIEEAKRQRRKRRMIGAGAATGAAAGTVGLAGYALGTPYRQIGRNVDANINPTSSTGSSLVRSSGRRVANAASSAKAGLGDIKHLFDEVWTYGRAYSPQYQKLNRNNRKLMMDQIEPFYRNHLDNFWDDPAYRQRSKDNLSAFKERKKYPHMTGKDSIGGVPGKESGIIDVTPKSKSMLRRAAKFVFRRGK